MNIKVKTNEDLGFDAFFNSAYHESRVEGAAVARVTAVRRGHYRLKNSEGEYMGKITGKQIFTARSSEDYPVIGDWVIITEVTHDQAVITSVLPRKTVVKRTKGENGDVQIIGANIEVVFVVESVDRDFNPNRFERYFALVRAGGAMPVAVLNKSDLISQEELDARCNYMRERFDSTDVLTTSIKNQDGLNSLRRFVKKGLTYAFLGSSGVGKSSLINVLLGEEKIETGQISARSERGCHTTTSREMYFLDEGGIVIDNPGIREVGTLEASDELHQVFAKIDSYAWKCKFVNCTHVHEPGCAVIAAVESGEMDRDQYGNYVKLKKEAAYTDMTVHEKHMKDRKFGRMVRTVKRDMKMKRYKNYDM